MPEEEVRLEQLYYRFADSEFGKHQASQTLRYCKKYGYGSREQMLDDLGTDIHPLEHMLYTHDRILVPLIGDLRSNGGYSPDEKNVLRTAALLHDIGECEHPKIEEALGFVVGDVLYNEKNGDDESNECKVREWLWPRLYPELDDDFIEQVESTISLDESDELSITFNIAERLGYYETAIRAGWLALSGLHGYNGHDDRTEQLAKLSFEVASHHHPVIEKRADDFSFIKHRLTQTSLEYSRITTELGELAKL